MGIAALLELSPYLHSTFIIGGFETLNVNRNIPLYKLETERMNRGRKFRQTSPYQENPTNIHNNHNLETAI